MKKSEILLAVLMASLLLTGLRHDDDNDECGEPPS